MPLAFVDAWHEVLHQRAAERPATAHPVIGYEISMDVVRRFSLLVDGRLFAAAALSSVAMHDRP